MEKVWYNFELYTWVSEKKMQGPLTGKFRERIASGNISLLVVMNYRLNNGL